MPPINGLSNIINGLSGNHQPPLKFTVAMASAKPTRAEIADAYFAHFGFKRSDAAFLKQHANGVDMFAHFERNFQLKPGSLKAHADGTARITLEADAQTYQTMQRLAKLHHAAPLPPPTATTNAPNALLIKQGYDSAALLKAKLHQQVDQQLANRQAATQQAVNQQAVNQSVTKQPAKQAAAAPPPTPSPAQARPEAKDTEGVGAFIEGVVAGDFSDNDSWSATGGKILGGLNPIADVRDIAAGLTHVAQGKDGAAFELGASLLGAIPLVGDAGKAIMRGGRRVAKEVAEDATARVAKEVAERTAKETAERTAGEAASAVLRSTPELRQSFRALFGEARYAEYAQEIEQVKAMRPELRDIPTEDLVAIRGYTSADYQILNTALRSGDQAKLKALEPYIKCAESGLSQLPSFKGVAFRGTDLTPAQAAQYVTGEIRTEPTFFSTAAEEAAAFSGNTKFYVSTINGKDVSILSEIPREKEILFPSGTQFKVVSVDIDPITGTRFIDMREIPKGEHQ